MTKKSGTVRHDKSVRYISDKEQRCLTEAQTRHVFKKVETDKEVNKGTKEQEIEDNKMTRNRLIKEDTNETNPYQMVILNKVYKDHIKRKQKIPWSILSDLIKYIDRSLDVAPSLTVKPLYYRQHKRLCHNLKTDKGLTVDIELKGDKLKEEYFDSYDGICVEISQPTRFDESTDLNTTYLDRIHTTRDMIIIWEKHSQFLDKRTEVESC